MTSWLDDVADAPPPPDEALTRSHRPVLVAADAAASESGPFDRSPPSCPPLRWVCLDDVADSEIEWFWLDRIPQGELTQIQGPDGAGKTALAVYMAVCVTTGQALYGHVQPTIPRVVIWIGTEESCRKIRRRLKRAGADLKRVIALADGERWLSVGKGVDELGALVEQHHAALIVIDPIVDVVPGDNNAVKHTREGLVPIVGLAHKTCATVLGLRHWVKGPRDARSKTSGSHAWRDVARASMHVAEHDGARAIAWDKLSDGEKPIALRFELVDVEGDPKLVISSEWPGLTADDLTMAEAPTQDDRSALDSAVAFLASTLELGDVAATEVERLAKDAGVAMRTLGRAKGRLGVVSVRRRLADGKTGAWCWRMPKPGGQPGPAGDQEFGHLASRGANKPEDAPATAPGQLAKLSDPGTVAGARATGGAGDESPVIVQVAKPERLGSGAVGHLAIDTAIIAALATDPRPTASVASDVATATGVSVSTARKRIASLVDSGQLAALGTDERQTIGYRRAPT